MYASEYHHRLKKYYSPSNSSLVIHVPGNRLSCKASGHDHDIPVLFAAVNQTRATFTVQVYCFLVCYISTYVFYDMN